MPYINIYLHIIWSTKNREKTITKELKPLLLDHIKSNANEKGIFIDTVNCVQDHIHLIVSLGTDHAIGKVVQLIKGESSHWVNKNKLVKGKFEWQDDYFAVSVSESGLDRVREYIKNQERHHEKKTFKQEYDEFMDKYGFVLIKG